MMGFTPELLWQQIQTLLPDTQRSDISQPKIPSKSPITLCVAFSGGLDSTTLLHALSVLTKNNKNTFILKAIHINHQLQKEANDWVLFCCDFCDERHISFQSVSVDVTETKKGIEAAARKARYSAFDKILKPSEFLLTGHHLDDQVETVFLQLLRGAGVDGAAAMAPLSKNKNYQLMRPLLTMGRAALQCYAEKENLTWIDDPSNFLDHFNRNFLRKNIFPIIEKRWPSYRSTISRFSKNARSASTVLESYVAQDYILCLDTSSDTLRTKILKTYAIEKRLMIIRHWLKQHCNLMPSEQVLLQVHASLYAADDSNPLIEWGAFQVRRYQHKLYIMLRETKLISRQPFQWRIQKPYQIDALGALISKESSGKGILKKFLGETVTIQFRQGGEACQPVGRAGTHSLKKLMQEASIPPWKRRHIPLLMIEDQIAAVIGYCYCEPFAAKKHESSVIISLV